MTRTIIDYHGHKALSDDGSTPKAASACEKTGGQMAQHNARLQMGLDSVVAKTDDYSLVTADIFGHKTFTMDNAAQKTFSLPSVSADDIGAEVSFLRLGAGDLVVDAADSDTIADSAAGGNVECDTVDENGWALVTLRLVTATRWAIIGGSGTWTTS